MRFISTRAHGVLDYTVGILLIIAPWLFNFANGEAAMWIPIILGVGTILYSLITRYELGITSAISMSTHLWLDGIAGLFLAISPWLFNFADLVLYPHLIVGLFEIGAALMTNTVPGVSYNRESAV